MTAGYTFDVFASLDGYGSASANWSGYWGKQGPELLDRRLALYSRERRMVFGANTYPSSMQMLAQQGGVRGARSVGDRDVENAGDGVDDAARAPRLAGRDRR